MADLAFAVVVLGVSLTWIDVVARHFLAMGSACTGGDFPGARPGLPESHQPHLCCDPVDADGENRRVHDRRTLRAPNLPKTRCAGLFGVLRFAMLDCGVR